jgi:hypothetical protein
MSFFVETRWGGSENAPSLDRMREILSELDQHDAEHPDTWLEHESGWGLSAYETGVLVWENVEADEIMPRHMIGVPRARVLELWIKLSEGRIDEIHREPWSPGYGT